MPEAKGQSLSGGPYMEQLMKKGEYGQLLEGEKTILQEQFHFKPESFIPVVTGQGTTYRLQPMDMSNRDPYEILKEVLPRAKSEEEFIAMAAELGDPPPLAGQPPAAMTPPASAGLPMPTSPLVPGMPGMVPPLTQGEARTTPRLGETLLGY